MDFYEGLQRFLLYANLPITLIIGLVIYYALHAVNNDFLKLSAIGLPLCA